MDPPSRGIECPWALGLGEERRGLANDLQHFLRHALNFPMWTRRHLKYETSRSTDLDHPGHSLSDGFQIPGLSASWAFETNGIKTGSMIR